MIDPRGLEMLEAEMRDRLKAKNEEIERLRTNVDLTKKLAEFAQWALHESWNHCELDGADIQDKAVALGLLVAVPYDPEVHGESEFDVEPGDDWYVWNDQMKSLLEHATEKHGSEPEGLEAG